MEEGNWKTLFRKCSLCPFMIRVKACWYDTFVQVQVCWHMSMGLIVFRKNSSCTFKCYLLGSFDGKSCNNSGCVEIK